MAADSGGAITGVDDEDLRQVTHSLVDQPDLDAHVVDRFFGQVQALAEARARRNWPGDHAGEFAVFVRAEYPREIATFLTTGEPIADLIGTNEPLLGRLFVLDQNASQGFSAALPFTQPGEVVQWLATCCGDLQVVILYRKTMLLVDRADGAEKGETRREPIRVATTAATVDALFEALLLFQREVLTPKVCPEGVWRSRSAQKYHPGPAPEKAIQAALKRFLNGWFRGTLRAEEEDPTEVGRIDIRLLSPGGASGGLSYWGIIELKVVKSFRHPRNRAGQPVAVRPIDNARDVAEGVTQAHAFGINRGAFAMVEVYDMRRDKAQDLRNHRVVREALDCCNPRPPIRLTAIFGSARDARNAGHVPGP